MDQPISANDAEQALNEISLSRQRMHEVIRLHHGHAYLWLWGVITILNCVGTHVFGVSYIQWPSLLTNLLGIVTSFWIGFTHSRRIRVQPDRRFIGVVALVTILHLFVIPLIVSWPNDPRRIFTYVTLYWTELYVLAGIWFSNYLLWSGVVCIAFALLGLFVFPSVFWLWCAITIGGTLIVSGFYVRYRWRW